MIKISDGKGERIDNLGGVMVNSSGGVPPAWVALTEYLPTTGKVLDYGSWQGLAGLLLLTSRHGTEPVFAHHSATRLAQVRENAGASGLNLEARAMFPLTDSWDSIILTAPEQGAALAMLAAQAGSALSPQGEVLIIDTHIREEEMGRVFTSVTALARGEGWTINRCSGPVGEAALPWREMGIEVCGQKLGLASLPGNFSPQGLDPGTRAMLEEAQIPQGGRVLDLACGYGVVGILTLKLGARGVAFVDDDLLALKATQHNLDRLGLTGELVHSHIPDVPGKFDCILTNPPYHTDYGVPKSFLEFAARRLEPGGWLWVVVKKPDWYANKIRALFGGCRIIERDGYYILSAQRRQRQEKNAAAKTTRKHLRRQQAANRGRRSNG